MREVVAGFPDDAARLAVPAGTTNEKSRQHRSLPFAVFSQLACGRPAQMLRRLTDVAAPKDVSDVLHVQRLLQHKRKEKASVDAGGEDDTHLSVGRRQVGTDLVLRSQVWCLFLPHHAS